MDFEKILITIEQAVKKNDLAILEGVIDMQRQMDLVLSCAMIHNAVDCFRDVLNNNPQPMDVSKVFKRSAKDAPLSLLTEFVSWASVHHPKENGHYEEILSRSALKYDRLDVITKILPTLKKSSQVYNNLYSDACVHGAIDCLRLFHDLKVPQNWNSCFTVAVFSNQLSSLKHLFVTAPSHIRCKREAGDGIFLLLTRTAATKKVAPKNDDCIGFLLEHTTTEEVISRFKHKMTASHINRLKHLKIQYERKVLQCHTQEAISVSAPKTMRKI